MKACMVKLGIFVVMVVLLFGLTTFGLSASADYSSPKDDIYLTLVNKDHRLPVGWEDKIELETAYNFQGEEFQVERETLRHFESLRDDLLLQGIDIELDSTYRTIDGQIDVWEWFRNEGYSDDYCFSHLAIPGFSEHHTGLAIDIGIIKDGVFINDNDEMIAEREIFAMIHERLADHGFILRYPPDRENSTGYSYEPWHFRYVGVEHAKFMTEFGMTLEEYLEMLPALTFSPLNLSGLFLAVFVVMMFVMGVAAQTILLRNWIFEKENAWRKEGKGKINHDIDDEQKN